VSSSIAFAVVSSSQVEDQIWYADGGASEHMTSKRSWFATFNQVAEKTWPVQVADNHELWVEGCGDINILTRAAGKVYVGVLRNVLYVPQLKKNLFSIIWTSC
jgi:hypothetical protein